MDLQDVLIKWFSNITFVKADSAIKKAQAYSSVQDWVQSQADTARSLAVAHIIPGKHFFVMPGELLGLFNLISQTCWGIGGLMERKVHGRSDMDNILRSWGGMGVKYLPVALDFYEDVESSWEKLRRYNRSINPFTFGKMSDGEKALIAYQVAERVSWEKANEKAIENALENIVDSPLYKSEIIAVKKLIVKASPAIANTIIAKFGTKVAGKALAGIVPVLGVKINGTINEYILTDISKTAFEFYSGHS